MSTTENRPPVILVVEDRTLLRMLAGDVLTEEAGYRVIEAVNADEALIMLESQHDVRLVFTDVNMPGSLNGFALARIVDMRFPGIKVIVTSGLARPRVGDLPKGKRFLPKPYASSALITLVQEMLGETARPVMAPLDPPPLSRAPRCSQRRSRSARWIPALVLRAASHSRFLGRKNRPLPRAFLIRPASLSSESAMRLKRSCSGPHSP